jgi:AAHS family 4-hydroxybenzoate transporter-like MFS transporter
MSDGISAGAGSGRGGTLDVTRFFEALALTPFHTRLLLISCLVTLFDGLDFTVMAYTLPYMREEMNLTDAQTGYVSAAAVAGQMIGSLACSYLADLYGRRPVIIVCTFLSAILTFMVGFAQSPDMLIFARFISGLAIGGLLPAIWSLNVEAMSSNRRATAVTVIMFGFSFGGFLAAPVTNWVAPDYGWHMVYFLCGALTLAVSMVLLFTLPESARWLVAKGAPAERIVPLLNRFDPALDAGRYGGFGLSDERKSDAKESPWVKFRKLFHGTLAYITPLIWAAYFCSSIAIYLKASFGPTFLETLGLERQTAAYIGSYGGLAGAIVGIFLLRFTEKRGPGWITLAPLLGIPAALAIGFGLDSGPAFIPVIIFGSIMIGAGHAAVISITSIYYPSMIRSNGGGWASFVAKIGATLAPLLAGFFFIGGKSDVLKGYNLTAACLAGIVVAVLVLAHYAKRLKGERADEAAALAAAPVAAPATAGA